jgi:membrane protein DedA with SNARE-associated domain
VASVTQLINAISHLPAWAVYLTMAALAFGEAAVFLGVVLPGETALLFGGVLAAAGQLSLPVMIGLAVAAAIIGDSVGYEVGRWGGVALRDSRAGRFVGEARWRRAEVFMTRRGGWAVFLGRWVGVLRALMPALAGMSRMPYRRFLAFNAAGGALWATVVVMAGYLAGASWQRVTTYFGWGAGALVTVVVAIAAATVVWRRVVARRATAPTDPAGSGSGTPGGQSTGARSGPRPGSCATATGTERP